MTTPLLETSLLIDAAKQYHSKRPMALGIGREHAIVETLLRYLELLYYFDAIVDVDDISRHKPDPQTFLRRVEMISVLLEACVVLSTQTLPL